MTCRIRRDDHVQSGLQYCSGNRIGKYQARFILPMTLSYARWLYSPDGKETTVHPGDVISPEAWAMNASSTQDARIDRCESWNQCSSIWNLETVPKSRSIPVPETSVRQEALHTPTD